MKIKISQSIFTDTILFSEMREVLLKYFLIIFLHISVEMNIICDKRNKSTTVISYLYSNLTLIYTGFEISINYIMHS